MLDISCWSTDLRVPGQTHLFSTHLNVSFSVHCLNASLASPSWNQKQLVELPLQSENRDLTGSRARLSNIKAHPQRFTSSGKALPPKNSKPEPLAGAQVSKPMSQWGTLTIVLMAGNFIIPHIDYIIHNRLSQIKLLVSHMALLLQKGLSSGLTHFIIPKLFHYMESHFAWLIRN